MNGKKYLTDEERSDARKESLRKYYIKHRDRLLLKTKKWQKENRDKTRASLKKWRERNRERYLSWGREYAIKNKEKRKDIRIRHYNKNGEVLRLKHRKYMKDNPHISIDCCARRRQRISPHPSYCKNKARDIIIMCKKISRETGIPHAVDHIIPLAKGGWHHQDNLQIIPKSLNSSKGADPFWISPSLSYKDWRDVPRELWPVDLVPKYLELIEKNKGLTIRWAVAA